MFCFVFINMTELYRISVNQAYLILKQILSFDKILVISKGIKPAIYTILFMSQNFPVIIVELFICQFKTNMLITSSVSTTTGN